MRALNNYAYRKAQSTLEYAFLIALVVGAILAMQAYVKRSLQGKLQMTSDQIADQYGYGVTQGTEHFESKLRSFEINAPGWGHPTSIRINKGSYEAESTRGLKSLDEVWPME